MLKRIICVGFILTAFVFMAAAQDINLDRWVFSGDLTTIYTLGNASDDQRIDTDTATVGAFFNSPTTGTRKNGYYTAANLIATFRPESWIEGYFKLYAVHRPGSFYMPLQMENLNRNDLSLSLDSVFGRVSVFDALNLELPVELFLKAGKYKAQASQYGVISKYKTEQVLFMMNTKTDFTYEIGVAVESPVNLSFSAATNYLLHQSVQRTYDEDGAFKHGNFVLNQYAPQFILAARLHDFNSLDAEILYGQNVSNIYSGHAIGASARYVLDISDEMSVPIGFSFAFHEKNIDILGQAAIAEDLRWPNATTTLTTNDFRASVGAALGAGLRYKTDLFNLDANIAGSFYYIKHYYRNDLPIFKLSVDSMFTMDRYFAGAGLIFGNLINSQWKTRDGISDEDYDHTFGLLENFGYEIYAGFNIGSNSRFVIGFNQNRGISLNNMLEARHEGQMKYKQAGTNWAQDQLAEAGGLYIKFFFRY